MQEYGHKSSGSEYCSGFVDEHDQWNNGFYCPRWGTEQSYCCGTERKRFCCPETHTQTHTDTIPSTIGQPHLELATSHVVAAVAGLVVAIAVTILAICCFCRCCVLYKRRKRSASHGSTDNLGGRGVGAPHPPATYTSWPARSPSYAEFLSTQPLYPLDDPPPYPGHDPHSSIDDKQLGCCHMQGHHRTRPNDATMETNADSESMDVLGNTTDTRHHSYGGLSERTAVDVHTENDDANSSHYYENVCLSERRILVNSRTDLDVTSRPCCSTSLQTSPETLMTSVERSRDFESANQAASSVDSVGEQYVLKSTDGGVYSVEL